MMAILHVVILSLVTIMIIPTKVTLAGGRLLVTEEITGRRLRHRRQSVAAENRPQPPTTSSIDLYNAMVLAEEELGVDSDDVESNDSGGNGSGSLLAMMTSSGGQRQQPTRLLKCASCSGILPRAVAAADEQSYCLPDVGNSAMKRRRRKRRRRRRDDDNANTDGENSQQDNDRPEIGVCSGAVRCWKAKVRERDGLVRISRGCVGGNGGGTHGDSGQGSASDPLLHPCMGAVPVVGNGGTNIGNNGTTTGDAPAATVWTSSHAYYSAAASESAGYAIECCAGRNKCNADGPFPPLPRGDRRGGVDQSPDDDDGSAQRSVVWWRRRWSWTALPVLIVVIATVAAVVYHKRQRIADKKRRRRRSDGHRRRRCKNGGKRPSSADSDSDFSDAKKNGGCSSESDTDASNSSSAELSSESSCCGDAKKGRRSRRRRHRRGKRGGGALTMVDLLRGVVVTGSKASPGKDDDDGGEYDSRRPQPNRYAEFSATAETTIDGCSGSSPPPYRPRERDPHRHHRHHRRDRGSGEDDEESRPADNADWTSGSGYGMPVLVQRTLAKQLQLRQLVGKGRYGEVWRATYWNGGHEHVAVKIFLSKDEPSWKRETEIYSTVLMRHEHILGFIGSDIMTSRNSYTTQLLLITHYHRHGSLYDFLQTSPPMVTMGVAPQHGRPPLTVVQMLNVLYTVASGLCHLHTEIHGKQGKPGIAHRDIKSKNILIKCAVTGTCCVADFGMAVTSQDATIPSGQQLTIVGAGGAAANNARVGTKRYMAPEVLDDSIISTALLASASTPATATKNNPNGVTVAANYNNNTTATAAAANSSTAAYRCFDAYRRGDVYSYSLVMWEVLSRTLISDANNSNTNDTAVSQPPPQQQEDQPQLEETQQPSVAHQLQQQSSNNGYDPYVYRAPYQDRAVGWDPGFDDMRRVVCSDDPVLSRPGIATEWLADSIIYGVVAVMRECWHGNPNVRLPALRIKKTLAKLLDQYSTEMKKRQQCEKEI